jgi:hypothetical protein
MRFEITINGKRYCVAGHNAHGVLSAVFSWVKRRPDRYDPKTHKHWTPEEWAAEELTFDVGGLDSSDPEGSRQISWNPKDGPIVLKPGDEVLVRVLADGEFDEPTFRSPVHK